LARATCSQTTGPIKYELDPEFSVGGGFWLGGGDL